MDSLFHINWGDNDNFYAIAPDKETAIKRMPDGKDMVNYVCALPELYNNIFKAGRDSFLDDVGNATIPLAESYERGLKAGREEERKGGTNSISYLEGVQDGIKKGRKEVIEWIEAQGQETFRTGYYPSQEMWQQKKKEWEL